MKKVSMVKYSIEQMNQLLGFLEAIATDSKSFDCSMKMLSTVLNIDSFLKDNAILFEEEIDENEMEETDIINTEDCDNENICESSEEVIVSCGGATK